MMIPKIKETKKYPAIIMEFKVRNIKREESLEDTVQTALTQIKEKCYDAELYDRGLKKEEIHHYGFAFEGKKSIDRIKRRKSNCYCDLKLFSYSSLTLSVL